MNQWKPSYTSAAAMTQVPTATAASAKRREVSLGRVVISARTPKQTRNDAVCPDGKPPPCLGAIGECGNGRPTQSFVNQTIAAVVHPVTAAMRKGRSRRRDQARAAAPTPRIAASTGGDSMSVR